GRGTVEMQLAFHGKRALDKAIVEAEALQDEHIGTEHLLLGLLCEGEDRRAAGIRKLMFPIPPPGLASETLGSYGVAPEQVRMAVRYLRGDYLLRGANMPDKSAALL